MNSNSVYLGRGIKSLRNLAGLSQEDVYERSGIAPASQSRIELGKTNPQIKTLEKIASAIGVSVQDILAAADKAKEIDSGSGKK